MVAKSVFLAIAGIVACGLLAVTATAEQGVEEQNRGRIEALEWTVEELKGEIRNLKWQLQSLETTPSRPAVEPLLGTWECSNRLATYTIVFERGGRLIQQEQTFGNAKDTNWSRVSESEVMVAGQRLLKTEFRGDDALTIEDINRRSTFDCTRKY